MASEHAQKSNSHESLPATTINLTDTLYSPIWRPGDSLPVPASLRRTTTVSRPRAIIGDSTAEELMTGGGDFFSVGTCPVQPCQRKQSPKPRVSADSGSKVTKPDKVHHKKTQRMQSPVDQSVQAPESRGLDQRREHRKVRSRPWTEISPVQKSNLKGSSRKEIHYQMSLPPDTWVKSEPRIYTKNIKWGDTFVLRRVKGDPLVPTQAEWKHDDGFRLWLLEKSAKSKMGLDIDKVFISEKKKNLKKKATDKQDNYESQKELYQCYLKERDKREAIERASLVFQKYSRGYLERMRQKKLRERVILETSGSFSGFVREYKGLLTRINMRKGLPPRAIFSADKANDYLERHERYCKTFSGMTVCNHLPVPLLERFVEKCEHGVSEDSIESAFNLVFGGCSSKADVVLLIDLPVSLGDENFKSSLTLQQELVDCLHIGPNHVRLGFIPFKSDVFVGFELGEHKTRDTVRKGFQKFRYYKGIPRTDLALKKMRKTFKRTGRVDGITAPRIAIMMSEGGDFTSRALTREADQARNKDNIKIYGIILGRNEKVGELLAVTGSEHHIFRVQNHFSAWRVRSELMKAANLKECRYCDWKSTQRSFIDTGRGMNRQEALEVMWQLAPPGSLLKNCVKGPEVAVGSALRFNDDDDDLCPEVDGNGALFDPCLKFLIKSRLDHEGKVLMPAGGSTNRDVIVSTWRDALKLAKEFEKAESERQEMEEQKERLSGYTDNVVQTPADQAQNEADDDVINCDVTDSSDSSDDEQGRHGNGQ